MLISLHLKDFALFDEIEVGFEPGLCLLTGETGAGKSILVEALQLLTGARAEVECVRSGAREARVEGLFHPGPDPWVADWFNASGMVYEGECVLGRTVSRTGRSAASVNGQLLTVAQLRELGSRLLQIHGQHQGQSLLDEEEHRRLLDTTPVTGGPAAKTARLARELASLSERLRISRRDAAARARRMETLRYEVEEIGRVAPHPGEDQELRAQRNRLAHSGGIVSEAESLLNLLRDGESSALVHLREALIRSRELGRLLPEWELLSRDIESASSVLSTVATLAEQTASTTLHDPEALEKVEGRLAQFERLTRKYGPDVDAVLSHYGAALDELQAIEAADRDPETLLRERDALFQTYLESARNLSRERRKASGALAAAVAAELKELALEKARFEVDLPARPATGPEQASGAGLEDVRFLFSANPGEPLKPLAKIASGGELSRTMLALLTALRGKAGPATLVFDEVDAGIGGRPAERVGRRLRDLGATRQVLCITHLPQIAAFAHHHLLADKRLAGGRTAVVVEALEGARRVEELARMLAGEEVTDTARKHARALLAAAK